MKTKSAARQSRIGIKSIARVATRKPDCGFTLIEMLVVIAIIGVLAALILHLAPSADSNKIRQRVRAEKEQLITAIEAYKAKRGFYPPDNQKKPQEFAINPLYYELAGTVATNKGGVDGFHLLGDISSFVPESTIKTQFGMDGFVNSNKEGQADDAQDFHKHLKTGQTAEFPKGSGVKILGVPVRGADTIFSPWYYNSSSPTHNPNSYDLWVEVNIGGKSNIFGNWSDK